MDLGYNLSDHQPNLYEHKLSARAIISNFGVTLTNSALGIVRVTASPHADFDHHRGLRVLIVRCLGSENTNSLTINGPYNLSAGPVNGKGVEVVMVPGIVVEGAAAVRSRVSFAEVIALYLRVVSAQPLPVNLVQVIRLQNSAADDAGPWRRLDSKIHTAEHDVPARLNQRSITLLGDSEGCTIGIIICDGSVRLESIRCTTYKIECLVRLAERRISGACCWLLVICQR